jgi:hypothetical protein
MNNDGENTIVGFSDADANLIADTPLLLAEVEQLREEKTFLWETYLKESAEVKRLREEVSSVIRGMLSDSEENASWGATVHAYIKGLQKVIE